MLFKKGTQISNFKIDDTWTEIEDELVNTEIGTYLKSYTETQEFKHKLDLYKSQKEIAELKQKLVDTDYQAIKFAEGIITADEYAKTKSQRQAWRDRINELEVKYGL